jgi:hypothetical protein
MLLALVVVVLATGGEWFLAAVYGENEIVCTQTTLPTSLVELPEASGLAASRQTPGLLWAINDSGQPRLLALDENGETKGRVAIAQAQLTDWEDISISSCASGSCVYIGDIGDNDAERSSVTIYRLPEPGAHEKTRQAAGMDVRFPDGPHDAEAMFVLPDGRIFVITKSSPSVVYNAARFEPGGSVTLERLMSLPIGHVTDAEASQDGTWVAVRSNDEAAFYRTESLLSGDVEHATMVSLAQYTEPQGEGIAFGARGAVFLAGEGGQKGIPGTFLRLECSLPTRDPG